MLIVLTPNHICIVSLQIYEKSYLPQNWKTEQCSSNSSLAQMRTCILELT